MVFFAVQVQKVGDINVVLTKQVLGLHLAVRVIEDLDPVDLEGVASVPVPACTKLSVPVYPVNCLHMLGYY